MKKEIIKKTVIARIESQLKPNWRLAIGNKNLTKEEMINHVKNEDEVGERIIQSHLLFLRSVAKGEFTNALCSVD